MSIAKNKQHQTDLQKFMSLFGMDKHKVSDTKVEYRVTDLDGMLHAAREIIRKNQLNLIAETSGSMAQIRAFEVKEVSNG
ncbi:hypothetical protein [Pedobacter sp. SYSU D00535]|uniref:hypothetical protein n=1 Tax=Pedobacter sp. SYSU D00535 TaxID=2810308 RepID=UPI001A96D126|nr:hypothetical protein [Pedobacter sp. SYSU D00535]